MEPVPTAAMVGMRWGWSTQKLPGAAWWEGGVACSMDEVCHHWQFPEGSQCWQVTKEKQ